MDREELLKTWAEPVKVLDHGYVKLVDVLGDDERIESAARISYDGGRGRKTSERRGLIRYLYRHQHMTPFEMCQVTVGMKLPVFVARQLVRHRTAKINELSGRYSVLPHDFYVPDVENLAKQSSDNKQGRGDVFPEDEALQLRAQMVSESTDAFATYDQFLAADMAKELARCGLPLSTYTEWYWSIDLRNLFNFLRLRLDAHAQYEIRVYAEVLWRIVQDWVPMAAEAFADFELDAKTFSRQEMAFLQDVLAQWKANVRVGCLDSSDPEALFTERLGYVLDNAGVTNKREREELLHKLGLR